MPKKSESTSKSEQESQSVLKSVSVNDFDIRNYKIDPIKENKEFKESPQLNGFPRYKYPVSKKSSDSSKAEDGYDRFILVTDPILMSKGGLPKLDGKWRKTENDCLYFWLPLLMTDENAAALYNKVLNPLDEYNTKKIVKEKNKEFITRVDSKGKTTSIKNLKYINCAKLSPKPQKGEDEDASDNEDDDDTKSSDRYMRIKVRLHTKYNKEAKQSDDKTVDTLVFINDKNGDPKTEPEKVKSMEDLRKLFEWNCEAQFVLEFNKFWVMKAEDSDGVKKCSLSLKCLQMYISKRPEISRSAGLGGIGIFGGKCASAKKQLKDDSDSGSGSEDEKPKKKGVSSKKKSSSDSESDSGSEKPAAKSKATKKASSDSESDSGSEKPAAKSKSSKKALSDSESDNDDSKSKKNTKKNDSESGSDSDDSVKPTAKSSKKAKSDSESDDASESEEEAPKKPVKKAASKSK